MNFARITPCGECCDGCGKRAAGQCQGCLETDGHCEEWAGSGRCRIYACAQKHGAGYLDWQEGR